MNKIPLLFTFDNGYAAQAAVTFESLLSNKYKHVNYAIYIITEDLSNNNINKLQLIIQKYSGTELHIIDGKKYINLPTHKIEGTCVGETILARSSLYRLIPTIFSEFNKYDKIIYLDVDIIIKKDISNLYDIELQDEYVAGVKHPKYLEYLIEHIDSNIRDRYIFSCLLVMNLKKMRITDYNQKILDVLNNKEITLKLLDQDVLNITCQGNVKYLEQHYNVTPDMYDLHENNKINYNNEYITIHEVLNAIYNPSIIHFIGSKPWNKKKNMPLKYEEWYYWLDNTPYKEDYKELKEYLKEYENNKYIYNIYLFNFIPIGKIKITGCRSNKIKIKFLKIIPILKLKK